MANQGDTLYQRTSPRLHPKDHKKLIEQPKWLMDVDLKPAKNIAMSLINIIYHIFTSYNLYISFINSVTMIFRIINQYKPSLIGGFNPTPLKNDGVRQIGENHPSYWGSLTTNQIINHHIFTTHKSIIH